MRRTLRQVIAETIRETNNQARPLEAAQGVIDAMALIDGKGNWEFQIATALIHLKAPYSAGTIVPTLGSVVVNGTGTLFTTAGFDDLRCELVIPGYRPYRIAEVTSDTQLALVEYFGRDTNLGLEVQPATTYNIYQAEYVLPNDCEGGRDLVIRGNYQYGFGGEIKKKSRAYFERHCDHVLNRNAAGGGPAIYTDADNLGDTAQASIRFYPYPLARMDMTLTYYRSLKFQDDPILSHNISGLTSIQTPVPLPETFNRVVVLLGAAFCMRRRKQQGWLPLYQEAMLMLDDLYARYAVSPAYEDVIDEDMDGPIGPVSGSIESGSGFYLGPYD